MPRSTAFVALILFTVLPDFPEDTKWLSSEKKQFILERLQDNDHGSPATTSSQKPEVTFDMAIRVIMRPKTLVAAFTYFILVMPAYAYSFFAPTIIKSYTTGTIHTQLLSVPPWACGFFAAMIVATISDKLRHRFLFATLPQLLAITGYAILLSVQNNAAVRYAAMFLIVLGIWVPYVSFLTLRQISAEPKTFVYGVHKTCLHLCLCR